MHFSLSFRMALTGHRTDQWFKGFRNRENVSLRKHTHAAQHAPPSLRGALSKFHAKLFRVRRHGKFELSDIANKDQNLQ